MEADKGREVASAAMTALVDRTVKSSAALQPAIIDNSRDNGLLCDVLGEKLRGCSSFSFSVAFVNQSGLEVIIQPLAEARDRGVKGRILTSDYLTFSEPKALERLMDMDAFLETRVMTDEAFHTKGYCFVEPGDQRTIIVGSANLTQGALKTNHEWSVRMTARESGKYCDDFDMAFNRVWEKARPIDKFWLGEYTKRWKERHDILRRLALKQERRLFPEIKPNQMQLEATRSLQKLRSEGKKKALIIAATGTGKTFLSCFDVKVYKPRRLLFLVHREQILESAAVSFEQVLGPSIHNEIGFLAGDRRQIDRKYVFSTINMLSRYVDERRLPRDHFEYVIIDEVHRAGAPSYQKIMSYLKPDFMLGMSATPDRTDHFNIYALFDYSIACDIRLQKAMENDLLCPFHYFGITDIEVDGQLLDEESSFNDLVREERVRNIVEKARFYGYSGDRVKGLIFCSRNEEASRLSVMMNAMGLRTVAVSGSTPVDLRMEYADRLQQDELDGHQLDYILSVDVFNEGVDIPKVNQIIMLRPTESPIIFIQQLGRGLRKDPDKEFVVVIDFIANYKKSYLIPVALAGDASYNKDNLRRDSLECTRLIPGNSTVNFDPVTRKLIYSKIDEANFSRTAFLRDQYLELKNKLGHVPTISDFRKDGNIDIQRYVDAFGSYYAFLRKVEKDYPVKLSPQAERILAYVSISFSEGKREQELDVLKRLLDAASPGIGLEAAADRSGWLLPDFVRSNLDLSFLKKPDREGRFQGCAIIDHKGNVDPAFRALLRDEGFRHELSEIVEDGLYRYRKDFSKKYKDTDLVLFEKYTYDDVCRLLRWSVSLTSLNIGGYKYDAQTRTLPVFINYEKEEDGIGYEDRFVSPGEIIALSKTKRSVDSPDADHIYKRTEADRNNRIYLFLRKNKDADLRKEFYFLGEVEATGDPVPVVVEGEKAFEIDYILDTPVRRDIYDYLTSSL